MLGSAAKWFAQLAMAGAAVFLLAPLLVIAAASFSPTPVFDLPIGGASLRWYGAISSLDGFWPALALSLEIATVSTMISLVLGTFAGIAIARGAMPGASFFSAALASPFMNRPGDGIFGSGPFIPFIALPLALDGDFYMASVSDCWAW